eukprot:scaffold7759_cov119-Isochrysis_galbana.AAC.3
MDLLLAWISAGSPRYGINLQRVLLTLLHGMRDTTGLIRGQIDRKVLDTVDNKRPHGASDCAPPPSLTEDSKAHDSAPIVCRKPTPVAP